MEAITTDVCQVSYPPECYGDSLAEIEHTIQEVVEKIFRDEHGMIRSGVYGKTMKPLRLEEVKDRPYGIGCYSENHHIPNELKPVFNNYENAGQCSGKYLRAMLQKYAVLGESQCLDYARRTFKAIELLWNNAAAQNHYPGGRGWMPKPFGGLADVTAMTECSPDQYADMTLGLDRYHREAADDEEREVIEQMIVSFADWWAEHDYATSYEGGTCWWKLRPDCIHAVHYFLYLNALAGRFRPSERYERGFELWLKVREESLKLWGGLKGANMIGLVTECTERLLSLRLDRKKLWMQVMSEERDVFSKRILVEDQAVAGLRYQQLDAFAAYYLCVADRVRGRHEFQDVARGLIEGYGRRRDFYHISRGMPLEKLPAVVTGDDYRDMFWAEGHICWLSAYWMLQSN